MPRINHAKAVTDIIIAKLAAGVKPWQRPWQGSTGAPLRHDGSAYRGINRLSLWAIADARDYTSPYWMTATQADAFKARIKPRAPSATTLFFARGSKTNHNPVSGVAEIRRFSFYRAYSVYNADEIEGLPEYYYRTPAANTPIPAEQNKRVARFMDPIPIACETRGYSAYYSPGRDVVVMPHHTLFRSPDHYTSTKLHELTHATGAAHRLNRTFGKRFGDDAYSMEELVADMGSGIGCSFLGLPPELLDSHASYLDHWLRVLKRDHTALIIAAQKAEAAFEWLAQHSSAHESGDEHHKTGDDARLAA